MSEDLRPQEATPSGVADAPVAVAVLGAGSWGTALAIQLARSGRQTRLWGRDSERLAHMARTRRNEKYLPDGAFPEALAVATGLPEALLGVRDALVVVPSQAFRAALLQILPHLAAEVRLAWATKGIEVATGLLPHEIAAEILGPARAVAVLSGPTFAREVGAGFPTAMTIASADPGFAGALARDLSSGSFRAYTSTDVVGVEVGGAVKNVLAVGAGLSDALGFGSNTRVALITRGLAEMMRLGVALGAQRDTFMGLAGLGDLVLTCTDNESRNRRFGLLLGSGKNPREALADIGQAVEGYITAKAVHGVAHRLKVEMPLCEGIYRVLYEGVPAREAVRELLARPIRAEQE
jgi:glycerol-3-phosphate dehydrogenase (NAD(P)+)